MGWLGRSLGQFGSDLGTGKTLAQQYLERQQQMKFAAATQALQQLMGPLQLKELQQRIAQSQQQMQLQRAPQYEGVTTLGDKSYGLTIDPLTGAFTKTELGAAAGPKAEQPKTLAELEAFYLQKGDFANLQRVEDAIKATQKEPAAKAETPFSLWREQNPGHPISEWLQLQEKYHPRAGAASQLSDEELDAKLDAVAQGTEKLDAGKLGVQEAARAKARGMTLPAAAIQGKGVPPPVLQQLLNQPVPDNPSPAQSLALATMADKVFGGGDNTADLRSRGKVPGSPGVFGFGKSAASYTPPTYSKAEYQQLLDAIRFGLGQTMAGPAQGGSGDLSDLGVKVK